MFIYTYFTIRICVLINVKYPTTANLRLDFSDKTVLELMKEKTYTGKEFAEFIKKK